MSRLGCLRFGAALLDLDVYESRECVSLYSLVLGEQFGLQEQAAQDQKIQMASRAVELLNAEFEDETGYALMSLDRQALGMSLEQARMSEVKGGLWRPQKGLHRGSWI